ncbi:MAG: hypothetical protein KDA58_02180 [Planctomycetaceae bacterium]|nr:hypothetical protein [Planctomycetaceae bacterium]
MALLMDMVDPRIQLKNRALAGVLAFLIPGAGHLYQGRTFKAAVYFVCIVGLFFTGMAMAEWKAVQPPGSWAGAPIDRGRTLKFAAQASLGIPALTSLVQARRYYGSNQEQVRTLDGSLTTAFQGGLEVTRESGLQAGPVVGTLSIEPSANQFGGAGIRGRIQGTMDGTPVDYLIGGSVALEAPLNSDTERGFSGQLIVEEGGRDVPIGTISGSVPRSFSSHFMMPLTDQQEQNLHARLGKKHELAMVLTWIAGLLNILVIWDAIDGPAYGYGDEEESTADGNAAPSEPAAASA